MNRRIPLTSEFLKRWAFAHVNITSHYPYMDKLRAMLAGAQDGKRGYWGIYEYNPDYF